jgi:hypothetical protein
LLPTTKRLALPCRGEHLPRTLVVTEMAAARVFALRKALPVYAHDPALWGRFEPSLAGTRITTDLVGCCSHLGSSHTSPPVGVSVVRRLVGTTWLWLSIAVVAVASAFEWTRADAHAGSPSGGGGHNAVQRGGPGARRDAFEKTLMKMARVLRFH